jgi:hypothetical protein
MSWIGHYEYMGHHVTWSKNLKNWSIAHKLYQNYDLLRVFNEKHIVLCDFSIKRLKLRFEFGGGVFLCGASRVQYSPPSPIFSFRTDPHSAMQEEVFVLCMTAEAHRSGIVQIWKSALFLRISEFRHFFRFVIFYFLMLACKMPRTLPARQCMQLLGQKKLQQTLHARSKHLEVACKVPSVLPARVSKDLCVRHAHI